MRISFPLLLAGVGLLLPSPPSFPPDAGLGSPVPTGVSLAIAVDSGAEHDGLPGAYVRARTLAERLRTWVSRGDIEADVAFVRRTEAELEVAVAALARYQDTEGLPWEAWIREWLPIDGDFAAALFRGAREALGREAMAIGRRIDFREAPDSLRIEIYRTYWIYDAVEANNRTYKLMLRERPRAQDNLRPRLVRDVLAPYRGPGDSQVNDLLRDIAMKDNFNERARRLAIQAIGERNFVNAAGDLISLYRTGSHSVYLKQRALIVGLELDPSRAREAIGGELPSANLQPQLHALVLELRRRYGLTGSPTNS